MNREQLHDDPIELGTATGDTKGSMMGYEDAEGGLWLHGLALADD